MFRTALAMLALSTGAAFAEAHTMAGMTANVADADGNDLGTVTMTPTPSGVMSVTIDLSGLPAGGMHGMHIHETGDCSAEDFSSAGGHLAGDRMHGTEVEGGPHPGDLPNTMISAEGTVMVEYWQPFLTMELADDEDGSAFIVHSGTDDYESQPSGDAGSRLACGVFEAS